MNKIKNFIKNKKTVGIVLIALSVIVVFTGAFLGVTYGAEKQRYNQASAETTALITTEVQYELDNKEHELKVADFVSSVDKIGITDSEWTMSGIACNDKVVPKEDFIQVERDFVECYDNQSFVFTADAVKTEKYLIETTIPNNKIYNEFKTIKTYINVSCVDTTSPKWEKSVDKITVKQGDAVNVTDYFSATDLSGTVNITTDKAIDTNTVGTQTVNVFATDTNGCVTNATVTVIVEENTAKVEAKEETTTEQNKQKNTTTKANTGTANETTTAKKQETTTKANTSSKQETTTQQKPQSTEHDHSGLTGNMGKWFNSRAEVNNYYNSIVNDWNTKYTNGEIIWEEYAKNCPYGYECWSCAECGKWTGNFYYR